MFEKETATLGYTSALGSANFMNCFDKDHVIQNMLLRNLFHILFMIIMKQQSHLGHITFNGATTIVTDH